MITPNVDCANFCYWMLNISWQQLTQPRINLIQTVYNAAITNTSVTDQVWKNFTQVTSWRYKYYEIWYSLSTTYNAYTNLWLAQLNIPPTTAYTKQVNLLINQLIADNNWQYLDRFYIFATEQQQHATISLKNPNAAPINVVNAPNWAANRGFTSNGTTSYLDTNFNPVTGSLIISQNSVSLGVYVRSNVDENRYDCGATSPTTTLNIRSKNASFANLGLYGAGSNSYSNADARGLNSGLRSSSAGGSVYKNGVLQNNFSQVSTAPINLNQYVLAYNNIGVPNGFSTKQIAMYFIGDKNINHATLYTAFQTFATAIGFQV